MQEERDDEERLLRSVALQNAHSVLIARQRAEEELVQAKNALQKQSEWLRITLASIGDAVIATDVEGRVTFMNGVAESLTGWPGEEAVGRPLSDVFHVVDEYSRLPAENPVIRALGQGTVPGPADRTLLIARDGTARPIDDSAAPMLGSEGAAVGCVLVFRDVTERNRADEDRARLAAIVESSEDAIVSKSLDGIILSWNAGAEQLFGYASHEAVGQPITLLIPPESWQEERAILERLRRGERVEHFETVRLTKDGRRIDISLTVSPVRNAEGRVVGASKVARDITERKRGEHALRESESRYRAIVEATPECVKIVGSDGTLLQMNPAGLAMVEADSPIAVLGQCVYDLIAPEYRDAFRAFNERVCRGEQGMLEFEIVGLRGTRRHMESNAVPLPAPDGGFAHLAVSRDVTARVAAERALKESQDRYRRAAAVAAQAAEANAKFRAFFEQGTNFAGVLAVDGTLVEANRLCLEACGFSRDDVMGKPFWECGWWSASAHLKEIVRTACIQAARGQQYRTETNYFLADGSERMVDLILAPVTGDAGRVLFIAATGTDITERSRMEDALREADRKKDDFIALLAHELRNPLAPIRNGLQVIRLAAGDAGAADRARAMMDRQLSHMVRLIDDLLDVSRISRNKMDLRRERVSLADVVSTAVETARPLIDAEGHELNVSLPQRPVFLDADLTRLAQVFSNLLTNSAKYTERGGRIWLTAERCEGGVVVSVRDTGIGIPAESLGNIFDMFSQVDRSIERTTGGLGIGLALVRGLVEMHGGTVTAESPGQGDGSTFTVTLPALPHRAEPTIDAPSDNSPNTLGPTQRILVADDNRDGADSLAMMLRLLGNEVGTAYDGVEAVERAEAFRPQLILMDMGMPRLNGLEATRRIRKQPWGCDITVIALTGWGQDGDRERSREAGCIGHLVKPVELADLQKLLRELQTKAD